MSAERLSAFLAACRAEPHDHVPVWFMRQAGRSLPEYRAVRGGGSILEAIRQPDLAAEITMQPVRRYGVDAAILYSDIVVPVAAVGFGVDVAPGVGPVVERPFAGEADL
ncbi:MAG: uroporphyrinogen decarboxylase, partial [Acidimicrobiales bacterium]|nr:uroporphyrinogen decarboxylase [Acidimicrobiales bacterium]